MASIGRDRNGTRRILFVDQDGSRKTIRLGKCNQRQAVTFKSKVEALIAGRFGGIDEATAAWVTTLPDDIHSRLEAVGLVSGRAPNVAIGEFLDEYIASRTDLKSGTVTVLGHTRRNLLDHFGPEKPLRDISKDEALGFRAFLQQQGLAEATIRRRCGIAKQFFTAAMEKGLIAGKNPFKSKKLPCSAKGNKDRQFFVSKQVTERILEDCPDAQWRLIVVLARFGGLRTPSEILRLRWSDIDWAKGRLTVHSPKTEHHAGHETREVPLFPEIREPLMQVFEAAEPGTEYVITRYRLKNKNLRQQFGRILEKANIKPWPRLFQNLRSSRQTELCQDFPEHVVCCWLGNSKLVAREHYEQVRDEDFDRAAQAPGNCAQNPAQYLSVLGGMAKEATPQEGPENADLLVSTAPSMTVQEGGMGPQGFEPWTKGL